VQGLRAGLAVFAGRPDDVFRVLHARTVREEVADLVRWAASRRVPCAEAPTPELDRLAQSMHEEGGHHEGLVLVTRPRRWVSPRDLAEALVRDRGAAVAIDRVRNPYNVGAVLRSAAFFGLDGALFGAQALPSQGAPGLASTAVRVAEGGVEHLALARTTDLADTLSRLRERGVRVVGADGHAPTAASGFTFGRPVVLVLGHEREGLGDRVRAQCDAVISIPGTGRVESLNVGVAAGVLMGMMMGMTGRG
jgi:RNA methyltransferase, TrmH family